MDTIFKNEAKTKQNKVSSISFLLVFALLKQKTNPLFLKNCFFNLFKIKFLIHVVSYQNKTKRR